jgi:RNA polymerase sigma-70 factor (ECF subfamily)
MTLSGNFERLALPHMDAAYNLAYWLVRSAADAEDIVQEAYLRAFRGFGRFNGGDMKPWLLTIVRHVAYNWLRARRTASNVVSLDEAFGAGEERQAHEEPSPEDHAISVAEGGLVTKALEGLTPTYREVIVLREIEGLSYREIATVIGAPTGTVMSRLSRARGELRGILSKLTKEGASNAV